MDFLWSVSRLPPLPEPRETKEQRLLPQYMENKVIHFGGSRAGIIHKGFNIKIFRSGP